MATNFVQEGKTLDYTASGADVASGEFVVVGILGGVAKTAIADGKTGAVCISGVFSVAKPVARLPKVQSSIGIAPMITSPLPHPAIRWLVWPQLPQQVVMQR